MRNSIRAVGLSLCMLVGSAISQDVAAFSMNDTAPFMPLSCGSRVDKNYIVGTGDNLWNIAKKMYGSTIEFSYETGKLISLPLVIVRANGLENYQLHKGQELIIPRGKRVSGDVCPADIKAVRVSEYEDVEKLGEL